MIVILEGPAGQSSDRLRQALAAAGTENVRTLRIGGKNVVLVHDADQDLVHELRSIAPSARAAAIETPSPLADRRSFSADTVVSVGSVDIGGPDFAVMAGPCAVESRAQLRESAAAAADGGAVVLRGGAYKPRTSPYAFQGTGHKGIELLADAGRELGLPVVSEVVDPRDVEHMAAHVDILQIGARNAQNFTLLGEAGRSGVPVLLKRGFGCTVEEWLGAAEYILHEGNGNVMLCERGIRTFEGSTRFTLDLAAVAVVKQRSHLPVIVDPSHGTGSRWLTTPLALAAAAVGADGVIVDVHTNAAAAMCDGAQALGHQEFHGLMARLRPVLSAVGRTLAARTEAQAA